MLGSIGDPCVQLISKAYYLHCISLLIECKKSIRHENNLNTLWYQCKQKCTQQKLKHHCLCILTTLRLKQRCYRTLMVALRRLKLASTLTSNPNRSLVLTWIFHRKTNTRRCRSLLERYKQSSQSKCLTNTLCTHSDKSTILLIGWSVYIYLPTINELMIVEMSNSSKHYSFDKCLAVTFFWNWNLEEMKRHAHFGCPFTSLIISYRRLVF